MSSSQPSVPNPTARNRDSAPEVERKPHDLGLNLVTPEHDPDWVDAILDWRWTWPIARILLTALFLLGAAIEILDFPAAAAVQEQYGLYPGWVWAIATITVQLVGSGIIISGRHVWLGAGMLAVFTGATEFIAHRFWELSGSAEFQQRNEFVEHLGLVAGFIMVALLAEERNRRVEAAQRVQRSSTRAKELS
jgi:uncharacterized membrane protein YphA (DoxX/SURF4 family)